jgi:hypothetical protein
MNTGNENPAILDMPRYFGRSMSKVLNGGNMGKSQKAS